MRLEGKTALVSGASRNIGRQIAITFAREGADVAVLAKNNPDELEAVAAACRAEGAGAVALPCDIADSAAVAETVAAATDALGRIDVLVSNAGIRPHTPILEVTDEEWHTVLGVNLSATFYLARAVLPGMMARRSGSIMAMGGKAALTGRGTTATVTASKHGLLGLIRAIAAEGAPYGIRANLINPGTINVERRNPEWYRDQAHEHGTAEHLRHLPMGRQGEPDDIAEACVYLASDASAFVTGNALNAMGGEYIL